MDHWDRKTSPIKNTYRKTFTETRSLVLLLFVVIEGEQDYNNNNRDEFKKPH